MELNWVLALLDTYIPSKIWLLEANTQSVEFKS